MNLHANCILRRQTICTALHGPLANVYKYQENQPQEEAERWRSLVLNLICS